MSSADISEQQIPEVPVIIEQFESSDNITYKITDANLNAEATIIELPNDGEKDNEMVVNENGNELRITEAKDVRNEDIEKGVISDVNNDMEWTNETNHQTDLNEKLIDNQKQNNGQLINDESKSQLLTDTPKPKRGKRNSVQKIANVEPSPLPTEENAQNSETRLTRSRYGRVQKTKTPDPEMLSYNVRRRSSSLKGNSVSEEPVSDPKQETIVTNLEGIKKDDDKKILFTPEVNNSKTDAESNSGARSLRRRISSPLKESGKKKKTDKLESVIGQIKAKGPNESEETPKITTDGSVKKKQTLKDYVPQKKSIELPMNNSASLDRDLLTSIPPQEGDYKVGDLIWAKLHGYPWWPCMVTVDPIEGKYSKITGASYKAGHIYHVQYFGPVAYRSWTNLGMVMPFEGREKYFEKAKSLQIGSPKSQSTKIAAKYAIKQSSKKHWDLSVEEAEEAMMCDSETRVKKYTFDYFPSKSQTKRKSDSSGSVSVSDIKRAKASNSPEDVYDFDDYDDIEESQNGTQSTPIIWKKRAVQKGDFAVYSKKHLSKLKSENPKLNKEELNNKLKEKWELLPEDLRAQYYDHRASSSSGIQTPKSADVLSNKTKVESQRKRGRPKDTKKSPIIPQQDDVKIDFNDSDSDGQLIIAESPTKKRSVKTTPKGKKSMNTSNLSEEKVISSESRNIASSKKQTPVVKPVKLKHKLSDKKSSETKKPLNLPQTEKPSIVPLISDQSTLNLHDYFDEFTSSEETSSISEAEIAENTKAAPEPFCAKCNDDNARHDDGNTLIACHGVCLQMFHRKCIDEEFEENTFKCTECQSGKHCCFICKKLPEGEEETHKCSDTKCGKFYHVTCFGKNYPVKFNTDEKDNFICPLHFCLNCHIESDGKKEFRPSKRRLVKCVSCPTAYHLGDYCIAAGTITVTPNDVICPDHYKNVKKKGKEKEKHINVNWCFSCLSGGQLICCESCPASFHEKCLEYPFDPESSFYCRDCTLRKQLHYGDIVWVKLGFYRWWPGRVCHPKTVPENIINMTHIVGEFPVYFFGSHDYYWVSKGRVFLYAEGDNKAAANSGGAKSNSNKTLKNVFKKAMDEAAVEFENWQTTKRVLRETMTANKPPSYTHIRSNKPIGQKEKVQNAKSDQYQSNLCECNPNNESPCTNETCLNRSLMTECDPICKAGERCRNQRFKKREYAKTKPFKTNSGAGWGLRALEDITKGQFVIEYVGEIIDDRECERRLKQSAENNDTNFYFLTIDKDNIIDAGPKGNLARFMNHSCQPNCETQKWMVSGATRVGLFAVCDIPAGSELTFNYNLDCRGNEKTVCVCGAPNCSGFIGVRPIKSDDAQVKSNNGNMKKKKEKKKKEGKQHFEKMHDDECFTCGEGGDLIMCDRKGCPKSFHLECLRLEKIPNGKWECPCHFCDVCGKPAKSMCSMCPNSLCKDHASTGKMTQLPDGGLLCSDHANEDINGVLIAPEVNSINDVENESIETARNATDDDSISLRNEKSSLSTFETTMVSETSQSIAVNEDTVKEAEDMKSSEEM